MISIIEGNCVDVMRSMEKKTARAIITSPPYWGLRRYGTPPVDWGDWSGELGREPTPQAYIAHLVEVFRAARDVLADDGTLWVNLGDTYGGGHVGNASSRSTLKGSTDRGAGETEARLQVPRGLSQKCLVGVPWRFALAMIDDGWILRQDVIWSKPNPMPESVKDRCTKAHEYIFLFSKQERYFWDYHAMQEPATGDVGKVQNTSGHPKISAFREVLGENRNSGLNRSKYQWPSTRNRRSVWSVQPVSPALGSEGAGHYATWPPALIRPMIRAATQAGDVVLDPFAGSGTTAVVAAQLGRRGVGIELSAEFCDIARRRAQRAQLGLSVD